MLNWLKNYQRKWLLGDLSAALVVALMLIPQGMAYAIIAGFPAVYGIYASILPAICYAIFASSMTQSVGPMAIISLMVFAAISPLATAGSPQYLQLAVLLALLAGFILIIFSLLKLGFIANFLSRPVMSGFVAGGVLLIFYSQLPAMYLNIHRQFSPITLLCAVFTLLILYLSKQFLTTILLKFKCSASISHIAPKLVPAIVLIIYCVILSQWNIADLKVVGNIPHGLPVLSLSFTWDNWRKILPSAFLLAFIIFISSQSAALALASKHGEKINTNQELFALGIANVASAVSQSFPVTGGISRSAVNVSAGAKTPLSSLVSALLIALILISPPHWLEQLPVSALAATIVFALIPMLDFSTLKHVWRYDKSDALAMLATFFGVIVIGVQEGVLIGVLFSLSNLLYRSSNPHIAILGKLPDSEHFRNIERYQVITLPRVLILRVDADFYFGNIDNILHNIQQKLSNYPDCADLILMMSAVNIFDTSALISFKEFQRELFTKGIRVHLSEVKGPIMDRLIHSDFPADFALCQGEIFLSTANAFKEVQKNSGKIKAHKYNIKERII